ncbi:hypothetical protein SASPL_148653 [Salvia splendens]|uniref:Pto-interacting protein 1 n=1 Tax=Salvia splendens TaxID=180675 RepID=A0A8X8W9Q6_SALSN|nr:hypothetical protein SASPL_148653 [Salvia splendens]
MAVKKRAARWQDYFPVCFKAETKQQSTSIQRISLLDLSSSTISEELSVSLAASNLHAFTLQELKLITHNFASTNFLGEGGFGPVHKGFIHEGLRPGLKAQPVAVKLLDLDGKQGHREWLLVRVIDPRLEGLYPELAAQKVAALAYQCLSYRPKLRPTMAEVVRVLEPLKDFDDAQTGTFVFTVSTDSNTVKCFPSETKLGEAKEVELDKVSDMKAVDI